MDLGLKDLRVLVAASSQGLGAAAAIQCALEGARVAINGRRLDKLAQTSAYIRDSTHAEVIAIPGDIARAEDATRLINEAAKQMGGLDILITNSGGPAAGTLETLTDEDWQQAFNLTLMSTVHLIRAALPVLRLSRQASILAVTSTAVKQPIENLLLSNSVRMSIAGLVKSLADELGPQGIRINAVLPGWTRTEHAIQVIKTQAEKREISVQELLRERTANIPLRRLAEPEEFGRVAAFLVSPAASYIHGAMIAADGGFMRATF